MSVAEADMLEDTSYASFTANQHVRRMAGRVWPAALFLITLAAQVRQVFLHESDSEKARVAVRLLFFFLTGHFSQSSIRTVQEQSLHAGATIRGNTSPNQRLGHLPDLKT